MFKVDKDAYYSTEELCEMMKVEKKVVWRWMKEWPTAVKIAKTWHVQGVDILNTLLKKKESKL